MMNRIDQVYTQYPCYGARRIREILRRDGIRANRKRIQRLMRQMGIEGVAPKRSTSMPAPGHRVYPYRCLEALAEIVESWCGRSAFCPRNRASPAATARMGRRVRRGIGVGHVSRSGSGGRRDGPLCARSGGPARRPASRRASAAGADTAPSLLESSASARYGHLVGRERNGMDHRPTGRVVLPVPGFRQHFQPPRTVLLQVHWGPVDAGACASTANHP